MDKDNSIYNIPSYARPQAYVFVEPENTEIYQELTAISEEILKCRSQIS